MSTCSELKQYAVVGDCLDLLPKVQDGSIDLVYIDPPYNSGRDFVEYDDRWDSMGDYLAYMVERLRELHRVLRSSGSLYLHSDSSSSHYLKVAPVNLACILVSVNLSECSLLGRIFSATY